MTSADDSATRIGRYSLYPPIASGGMATVHFGRLTASGGFARTVAIKRLHPNYVREQEFVDRFLDEARMAARIRHPNVVPTLDVVSRDGEVFLVMEYVHGESLGKLISKSIAKDEDVPLRIASAIMTSMLQGLHSAHEARSEAGVPLRIVHRDVSPQNVIVGTDGVTRILDFGIAKAVDRMHSTQDGTLRGKIGYMSPEQLLDVGVDRLTDVYAAGVVFWELLTGVRMFGDATIGAIAARITTGAPPSLPSAHRNDIPPELEALLMKALSRDVAQRPPTALAFALAIEKLVEPASPSRVVDWVDSLVHDVLTARARLVADIESGLVAPIRFDDSTGARANVEEVLSAAPVAVPSARPAPSAPLTQALTTGDVLAPPRRRKMAWALAAMVVAVAVAGVVAFGMMRDVYRPAASEPERDPGSSEVNAIVTPPATAAAPPPTTVAPTAPSTITSAIAASPPSTSGTSGSRRPRHDGHAAVTAAPSAAPPSAQASAVAPTPEPASTDNLYRSRR